jgi:hypothetical protein
MERRKITLPVSPDPSRPTGDRGLRTELFCDAGTSLKGSLMVVLIVGQTSRRYIPRNASRFEILLTSKGLCTLSGARGPMVDLSSYLQGENFLGGGVPRLEVQTTLAGRYQ